jgi:hypothetical protein
MADVGPYGGLDVEAKYALGQACAGTAAWTVSARSLQSFHAFSYVSVCCSGHGVSVGQPYAGCGCSTWACASSAAFCISYEIIECAFHVHEPYAARAGQICLLTSMPHGHASSGGISL